MNFIPKPCQHCPFRKDVTPFLHPQRAAELAESAKAWFSDFFCHKTLVHVEDDEEGGDLRVTRKSLLCAGFLTLKATEISVTPVGFEPSPDQCYESAEEMTEAYSHEWRKR